MKSIKKIVLSIVAIFLYTNSVAQIKNAKTETVKIYGNCEMCKATIEKAGNRKKVSKVDWNKDTKIATLVYNSKTTSQDEILKRIALVGYDNEKYLSPNDVYAKLPECCKYTRNIKTITKLDTAQKISSSNNTSTINPTSTVLKTIFDDYFTLKDALVKTDASSASAKANKLVTSINGVKMETLSSEEHMVWMKVLSSLKEKSKQISETKEIEKQRNLFDGLSANMYELIKVSKHTEIIYYQQCPMYNDGKGANWLSKESVIKNPYFGSMMISCGKTVETLK